MATPTTWTNEEYAIVAGALLYPESRLAVVVSGVTPEAAFAYQLDGRLAQLGPEAKQRVLDLARQIRAGESALLAGMLGSSCGSQRGAVLQVGDIRLDPRLGRTEREALLSRARALLSSMVDWPVNPNTSLEAGGGINGRWSS